MRRPDGGHAAAPRCLLYVPRGLDAPLDLLDGLRQRKVSVREASEAITAMADLAAEAFGFLILVEPEVSRDSGRLADAVRRFHPTVTIWQYSEGGEPKLARFDGRPGNGRAPSAAATRRAPRLARIPDAPAPDGSAPTPPKTGAEAPVDLTPEELAMLLPPADHPKDERA